MVPPTAAGVATERAGFTYGTTEREWPRQRDSAELESDGGRTVAVDTPARSGGAEGGRRLGPKRRAAEMWLLVVLCTGAAVTAAVLLAGARDQDKLSVPPSSTPAVPTPAPTTTALGQPVDEKQVVAETFVAFERAFDDASQLPDPFFPALRATATGSALKEQFDQLQAWKNSGRVVRFPPDAVRLYKPEEVLIDGTTAKVRACVASGGQLVVVATGEVVAGDVVTRRFLATLVQEEGRWKVADVVVEQRWEGVAGCAA